MSKTVIAVSAGPREGWNTDTLITDASNGAELAGAANGLIIGSPNYLGELTTSFRALYERLVFQNLTYNRETPCCNRRPIPVLLIMTSNAPDTAYTGLLEGYRQTLSHFVGPTEVFVSGDTIRLHDYGKTDWEWSMFDPEANNLRHETVFPEKRKRVLDMGATLFKSEVPRNLH